MTPTADGLYDFRLDQPLWVGWCRVRLADGVFTRPDEPMFMVARDWMETMYPNAEWRKAK